MPKTIPFLNAVTKIRLYHRYFAKIPVNTPDFITGP